MYQLVQSQQLLQQHMENLKQQIVAFQEKSNTWQHQLTHQSSQLSQYQAKEAGMLLYFLFSLSFLFVLLVFIQQSFIIK